MTFSKSKSVTDKRVRAPLRVLALSDVAFGYGSPQLLQLIDSIGQQFPVSQCLVLEPDQKGRAPKSADRPNLEVRRIVTSLPPYDNAFRVEFARRASSILREFDPHILIVSHAWVLAPVLMTDMQDRLLIYYMLESLSHQTVDLGQTAIELNRRALGDANIVISPERNRTRADLHGLGWSLPHIHEVLNVGSLPEDTGPRPRIPRILHAGSIGEQTLVNMLLSDDLSEVGFDLCGPAETSQARAILEEATKRPNIRYLGMLPQDEVIELRKSYAYSLAFWQPTNVNQLYASPNKFFETIACGTPPIAGPHPQCADIIARSNCGLVAMNWTQNTITWTILHAMNLFKEAFPDADFTKGVLNSATATHPRKELMNPDPESRYAQMVANCRTATVNELNWGTQVKAVLDKVGTELRRLNLID